MRNRGYLAVLVVLSVESALLAGCERAAGPLAVSNFAIAGVETVTATSTASTAPVTYTVTVGWDVSEIEADETASAALTGLRVYTDMDDEAGSPEVNEEVPAGTRSFTFTGLLPAEHVSLRVAAVYADGTYEDAASTDYTATIAFVGGPWITGSTYTEPDCRSFSLGWFNNADDLPTSASELADFYYYNAYNEELFFTAAGEAKWILVAVNEVTDTNDTAEQRDNVQWLNGDVCLLDRNVAGVTNDGEDFADVTLEIFDVEGNALLSLSGTATEGSMGSTDFSTLLASVDEGYYADKPGFFFVKVTCDSMPATYSANNTGMLGRWGLAMPGARRP